MESDSKQAKVQTYPGVVSSHKFQNFLRTHMAFVFHSGSHLRMQTSNCLVIMGSLFIMFFFFIRLLFWFIFQNLSQNTKGKSGLKQTQLELFHFSSAAPLVQVTQRSYSHTWLCPSPKRDCLWPESWTGERKWKQQANL